MIFHNYKERFRGDAHGLGFELNQYYTAGPMASLETAESYGIHGHDACDRPAYEHFLFALCEQGTPKQRVEQ